MDDDHLVPLVATVTKATPCYYFIGDFFNILKAFIGTNYQALPFAFKNSGLVVGIIGVFIIATLTDYCCGLLIYCKYVIIDRAVNEERAKNVLSDEELKKFRDELANTVGYGDIGRRAFGGKWGDFVYHLIQIAVWFTQYLTVAAYFIFIGNAAMELFPLTPALIPLGNTTTDTGMEAALPFLSLYHLPGPDVDPELDANARHHHDLTTQATNITTPTAAPGNLTTPLPTPIIYMVTTAWDLRLLTLLPLAFFLGTSMIRKVRHIAFFSIVASVALAAGALAVFAYMCVGFEVNEHGFSLAKWSTLPLFVGQLISAYEGIGCIVPIESSMGGRPALFRRFLHANVYIVFVILCGFGCVGYLRYGDQVQQLVVHQIHHSTLSVLIDVTLIISVLFTYPIQCFPVIEIIENYLFAPGSCCCGSKPEGASADQQVVNDILGTSDLEASLEASVSEVAVHVPQKVSRWKRNAVRVLLTLSVCAVGVLARDSYAYLAAFSGAIGCSLLAYVLPCVIHLRLCARTEPAGYVLLHVTIIGLAVVASAFTLFTIVMKIVTGDAL